MSCFLQKEFEAQELFNSFFLYTRFEHFIRLILLGASILYVLIYTPYLKKDHLAKPEYSIVVLASTLGMLLMVAANDLLPLYLGIELQSLAVYILVAMSRRNYKSSEAAIKYFVLGSLASAFILFGSSYVYGFIGATDFQSIAGALRLTDTTPPLLGIAFCFIFFGLIFKVALAPFHMWAPDVYEGSAMPVTLFIASLPKVATFAVLVKFLMGPFFTFSYIWRPLVLTIALLSIFLGAIAALYQSNLKRLFAYSAISHAGFALLGLLSHYKADVESVLVYMIIYLVLIMTLFALLMTLRRKDQLIEKIDELSGFAKAHPLSALGLSLLMFSFIGLPPFAGFFAKFSVFYAAINAGYTWVVALSVLATVIAATYYLRIVKVMYFNEPIGGEMGIVFDRQASKSVLIIIYLGVLLSTFLLVYPEPLIKQSQLAFRALL